MANADKELLEVAEQRDHGAAVAGIKLVVVDDDLNFHAYEDGKLMFQKELSRPEAMTLAYKLLRALKNGS